MHGMTLCQGTSCRDLLSNGHLHGPYDLLSGHHLTTLTPKNPSSHGPYDLLSGHHLTTLTPKNPSHI